MKKQIIGSVMVIMMLAATGILTVGCDQLSNTQMKVIADLAGKVSAVTWIGIDNPTPEVKAQVSDICVVIKDKVGLVKEGRTYTEVIMPLLEDYIIAYVDEQYRPICTVGAGTLLSGIDVMFALNSQFLTQQDFASELVSEFCDGASGGLALAADGPVILAALQNNAIRSAQMR